jgi:hypothetical protein
MATGKLNNRRECCLMPVTLHTRLENSTRDDTGQVILCQADDD